MADTSTDPSQQDSPSFLASLFNTVDPTSNTGFVGSLVNGSAPGAPTWQQRLQGLGDAMAAYGQPPGTLQRIQAQRLANQGQGLQNQAAGLNNYLLAQATIPARLAMMRQYQQMMGGGSAAPAGPLAQPAAQPSQQPPTGLLAQPQASGVQGLLSNPGVASTLASATNNPTPAAPGQPMQGPPASQPPTAATQGGPASGAFITPQMARDFALLGGASGVKDPTAFLPYAMPQNGIVYDASGGAAPAPGYPQARAAIEGAASQAQEEGKLPGELALQNNAGNQARATEGYGAQFRMQPVINSDGSMGFQSDAQLAGGGTGPNGPIPAASAAPYKAEQIKQLSTVDDNAANAQEGLAAVQALRNQIGQTYQGAGAKDLQALRKNWISVANLMGAKIDPSTLDSASSAEQINLQGQKLISSSVKQLGSREAANIYNQIAGVKPGLESTPQGFRQMLDGLQLGYQREVDQQNFAHGYYGAPGNAVKIDALNQFNQTAPASLYVPKPVAKGVQPVNGQFYRMNDGRLGRYTSQDNSLIPVTQ